MKVKAKAKAKAKVEATVKAKAKVPARRTVLVILSNRFARLEEPRYLEIVCKPDGTILEERPLKRAPSRPVYDEVWENDDAKTSLDSCRSIKRHYKHRLIKPAAVKP
jgi:hypothetical protein